MHHLHHLDLEPEHLAAEAATRQAILAASALPQLLLRVACGPYGMTRFHLGLLELLESVLAETVLITKKLCALMLADRDGEGFGLRAELEPADREVATLYALAIASQDAVDGCCLLAGESVVVTGRLKSPFVHRLRSDDLSQALIDELAAYLEFYRNHPDPERRCASPRRIPVCAAAFFGLLHNSVLGRLADFDRYRPALEQLRLTVGTRHYLGVTRQQDDESARLLPVWPKDIVGNQEYVAAALRLARDVAGFDFEQGQNPKKLNPVLFAQGAPGCGKTMTAHAVGNYFLQYCQEREVPARFLVIRRTDWASSFQNASAGQLIKIFREQVDGFEGVVGVYWPDIDTAFAARTDPGLRGEESNILGASFGIFDGTLIPKNGKWFLICDANYTNMDEATMSRISQDPYKIFGPTTAADFVELMREKKLHDFTDLLPIDESHWLELGQMCVDFGFSGRNVESICQKILTEIQDVEAPPEYYHVGYSERIHILRGLAKPLGSVRFQEILRQYKGFEKSAEAQNEARRFDHRVKEIVLNLSAQQAAARTFDEV